MSDNENENEAERLGAWSAVFRSELGAGTLDQQRPPRWRWVASAADGDAADPGVVLTTLAEPGAGGLTIELPGPGTTWAGLTILSTSEALWTAGALLTGDRGFDDAVVVFASAVYAHGIFDADARELLRRLVDAGVSVLAGAVWLGPTRAREVAADAVAPLFRDMLALRDLLAGLDYDAAARRVIAIASGDPEASVRAHYAALARDPAFAQHVVERDVQGDQGDASFATLAAHAGNPALQFGLRRAALERLIAEHPLMQVAAIRCVPWHDMADYEGIEIGLAQALRGTRADAAEGVILIARLIYRLLERVPSELALALVEALPYELSYHGRRGLWELIGHPQTAVARLARERFLGSFVGFRGLAEALADSPTLNDLAGWPALAQEVLERAAKAFTSTVTASDFVALKVNEDEQAAARHVVRRLVSRLYDVDPSGQRLWGGDGQWPTSRLALPLIEAHRRTADVAGRELLVGIIELETDADTNDVARAALGALMALPPSPESLRAVAKDAHPKDLYELATADHTPAYALAYLVAAFPYDRGDAAQLRFIQAVSDLGSAAEVELLLGLLDGGSPAVLCATLAALGRHADSTALPQIEPYASGFFRDAEVKRAAKDALRMIGERGAPKGSLSLAEGGGLAVADDDP